MSKRPLRCRIFGHRWGMWFGEEWHGVPLWRTASLHLRVVCKTCGALGTLDNRGVTER